jgi:hypothetical protein
VAGWPVRKSFREKLAEAKREAATQTEVAGFDGVLRLLLGGEPRPTQYTFICDPTRIKGYKGPAGCAKTSTIVACGLLRALFSPGSKGLIARHDYNDLMDTTALRAEEMISRLPKGVLIDRDKSPPMKWWIRPIPREDAGGTLHDEPSQITFMGLKEALGSYEFDWAIVDEADEVVAARVHEINTRLRHTKGFKSPFMLAVAFNPPDKHHWLYEACTGRDYKDKKVAEPWIKLFNPVPNENAVNLPPNYYETLAKTLTEDMKQRLVDGEWGSTFTGAPVYRGFKYTTHVKDNIPFDKERPLLRGWDFGYYRPACVWAQMDSLGRLVALREYLGSQQDATEFARTCKKLTSEWFPDAVSVVDFGDPAVVQKKDTGSTLGILAKEGILMRYRPSKIEEGVNIIRRTLNLMIDGEPAMQFDRRGAALLIQAMRGGYHLEEKVEDGGTDSKGLKPVKDGFFEHIADAWRYLCLNVMNMHGSYVESMLQSAAEAFTGGLPTDLSFDPTEGR